MSINLAEVFTLAFFYVLTSELNLYIIILPLIWPVLRPVGSSF